MSLEIGHDGGSIFVYLCIITHVFVYQVSVTRIVRHATLILSAAVEAGDIPLQAFGMSTSLPFLSNCFLNGMNSTPIMKGRRAGGTLTPPSSCQFSKRQHSVRSVAERVEFNMCTYSFLASTPGVLTERKRISRRRA